jgi:hypothetical protein
MADLTGGAIGCLAGSVAGFAQGFAYRVFRKRTQAELPDDNELAALRMNTKLLPPRKDKGWEKERLRIATRPKYGLRVERAIFVVSAMLLVIAVVLFALDA